MGVFDSLLPQAAQPAPTLDAILAGAHPDFSARDDGSTLLGSIKASGGVVNEPTVDHYGNLLPIAQMSDGTLRFDNQSGLAPPLARAAVGMATAPYETAKEIGSGRLLNDVGALYDGSLDDGTETGGFTRQAAMQDVGGRMLGVAGGVLSPSALEAKPAGSLGAFGGRAAEATGAERIAGNNRFVRDLQSGADSAAKEHVLSLIPPPLSIPERAVRGTAGMSVQDIMSSEPLWGYSRQLADQHGVPHSEAFATLANHIFDTHGHGVSLTPAAAKGFMQMERLKYGMDPSTD